jgi:hypothetical protein
MYVEYAWVERLYNDRPAACNANKINNACMWRHACLKQIITKRRLMESSPQPAHLFSAAVPAIFDLPAGSLISAHVWANQCATSARTATATGMQRAPARTL